MTHSSVDSAVTSAVRAACPDLVVDGVEHRSSKALLLAGTLHGHAVVAKLLTLDDDFWRGTFAREVRAYTAFAATPPPVAVPRLHAADAAAGLLVIDRVDGEPAATDRYPAALPADTVDAVLDVIASLRSWDPPAALAERVFDYPARLRRYHDIGLLETADVDVLRVLLGRTDNRWEFAHGDLLPANVRRTVDGPVVLDWEFTGLYLPGFDLALQWVLLGESPGLRRRIERLADEPEVSPGFWVNIACALTRELRIHRELPDGAERARRLARLDADWSAARARIHQVAGTTG